MQNRLISSENIEQLQGLIVQLTEQLQTKTIELQQKDQTIYSLQHALKTALHFRFGKRSEKASAHQCQ